MQIEYCVRVPQYSWFNKEHIDHVYMLIREATESITQMTRV